MPASPQFPNLPQDWRETTERLAPLGTFVRMWSRSSLPVNPRVLFIVHGWGEHSDRYRHFPFYLQAEVDMVVATDLYGHGESPGAKGSCRTSEDWLGGVELALKSVESRMRSNGHTVRSVVLGHSFGGLLTIELARQKRWHHAQHLFISAPLLGLVNEPPKWKTWLGKILESLAPQFPLANDVEPSMISSDAAVVTHYRFDPLNHGLITPRAYQQMTEMIERNLEKTSPLDYAITLISPGADPLVSEKVSSHWFSKLDATDAHKKSHLKFPGLRHESFNEVEKEKVFAEFAARLACIY
jgi:alpha-beta hydrolase superfamily lysophospholipase